MKTNKNIPYYIVALLLFIVLKLIYTLTEIEELKFLLKPTDALVGVFTGSESIYLEGSGFFHKQLNIVIDKSCAGFNFWILCFLLFSYLTIQHFNNAVFKILTIISSLLAAYILTLFVNTSRIIASIIIQNQTKDLLRGQQHIVHEAIGIITNLTFLVLSYILIEKYLKFKRPNAKLT